MNTDIPDFRAVWVWDSGWISIYRNGKVHNYAPRQYPSGWTRRGKLITLLRKQGWQEYPLRAQKAPGYEFLDPNNRDSPAFIAWKATKEEQHETE